VEIESIDDDTLKWLEIVLVVCEKKWERKSRSRGGEKKRWVEK
jgi:hypothetical protein